MPSPESSYDTDTDSAAGLIDPPSEPGPRQSSRLETAGAWTLEIQAPPGPIASRRGAAGRRARRLRPPTIEDPVGLSILIPVYNEQATVRSVLERVRAVPFPTRTEIVVVNDGSTDATDRILQSLPDWPDVRVFAHDRNQGKGAAVRTALRHARGRIVVIQDADEELDPADLLPMYDLVSRGAAPVCYGSRFARGAGRLKWRPIYWANRLLNGTCNVLNGLKLTDMNTCYKMMPAEIAARLSLESRGFALEPEITTKLARLGVAIQELPVRYTPRTASEGKKIRAIDFFRYLRAMVYFRFIGRGREGAGAVTVEMRIDPTR